MDIHVLYLDNHLLAVLKPPGLVTQPSGHHADSLEGRAKAYLKQRFDKPGRVFLEAVHRLDRPVGGVVLFARTGKALSRLNAAVRQREARKTYLGVVEGALSPSDGELENWLVHAEHHARAVEAGADGAKRALLAYRTLAADGGRSLVCIQLLTGRYHQIRVQLAAAGHPLCGDRLYGSTVRLDGHRIALLHWLLTFPHPVGGEPVTIRAPVPEGTPWTAFRGRLAQENAYSPGRAGGGDVKEGEP